MKESQLCEMDDYATNIEKSALSEFGYDKKMDRNINYSVISKGLGKLKWKPSGRLSIINLYSLMDVINLSIEYSRGDPSKKIQALDNINDYLKKAEETEKYFIAPEFGQVKEEISGDNEKFSGYVDRILLSESDLAEYFVEPKISARKFFIRKNILNYCHDKPQLLGFGPKRVILYMTLREVADYFKDNREKEYLFDEFCKGQFRIDYGIEDISNSPKKDVPKKPEQKERLVSKVDDPDKSSVPKISSLPDPGNSDSIGDIKEEFMKVVASYNLALRKIRETNNQVPDLSQIVLNLESEKTKLNLDVLELIKKGKSLETEYSMLEKRYDVVVRSLQEARKEIKNISRKSDGSAPHINDRGPLKSEDDGLVKRLRSELEDARSELEDVRSDLKEERQNSSSLRSDYKSRITELSSEVDKARVQLEAYSMEEVPVVSDSLFYTHDEWLSILGCTPEDFHLILSKAKPAVEDNGSKFYTVPSIKLAVQDAGLDGLADLLELTD